MPRYGTKIKKRSKTKIKRQAKPLRRYRSRFVGDERIREQWDHKLTTKQNYENLGLNVDPNTPTELHKSIEGAENALDDEPKLFHVPDSDFLSERNPRKPENYMSEEEIKYLRPLIAKYRDDFKAMERDIKINKQQWTAQKLKTRCARLALLDAKVIRNVAPAKTTDAEKDE
ncbi:hypothetical protein Poli38472_006917 [Pythium oligandrum]|uniref:Nucleolar protein 16 n=1 Tax=Pythium oligandrum TaxID=41045 RepID=A0A8K1FGJ6_PYTOL|nr:hypothetical protein Poli38472_006917 [Pythium oligandrum]|eukprot:TMW58772.1 hypothetical protein Poli38472_006917 [Pythium oligandrum]